MPRQLRRKNIKNAIKSYIFPVFARCYQGCAVHALWNPDCDINEIWKKREELQEILTEDKRIVAFFTCIAILDVAKKQGKRNSVDNVETDPFASEPSHKDADDEEEESLIELHHFLRKRT